MFVTEALAQTETPATDHALPPSDPAAAAHGETVQVEGEHGVFPPLNPEFFASQILWLAITFGVFYLVLDRVIIPRLSGILENRRDRIAFDLEAAEQMKAEADEAEAAYEQELAEARARSQEIAGAARDAARSDADRERRKIEKELDEKLAAAQARISEIKATAMADVGTIAEDVTETIVRELTDLDVSREVASEAVRAVRA
ncbi:F0F1 ATP synthase subunit B [Consotaella salsifontis]|uniref:ATP synthase subunit b n=1 Tax=Consotaella salsifontis TaxID=1365950 RepID=A0A1T4N0V0_9HYPH|nr:F0F1 ATP synthase subunit B [Consotaella salsifontis]SJZ72919.1 F-type H+-transporting ATPase subunit b [Consotaella salsifontis]